MLPAKSLRVFHEKGNYTTLAPAAESGRLRRLPRHLNLSRLLRRKFAEWKFEKSYVSQYIWNQFRYEQVGRNRRGQFLEPAHPGVQSLTRWMEVLARRGAGGEILADGNLQPTAVFKHVQTRTEWLDACSFAGIPFVAMAALQQDWLTFVPDPTSAAFKVVECHFDFSHVTRTLATHDTVLLFFETGRVILVLKILCKSPAGLLSDIIRKGERNLSDREKHRIRKIEVTDYIEWQETILAQPISPDVPRNPRP